MFDLIAGLPLHPLIVHAVVVLAPLAALLALAYVALPARQALLRWPLAALAVIAGGSAVVADQSGEALQHRLESAGLESDLIETHAEIGEATTVVTVLFMLFALACVLFALRPTTAAKRGGALRVVSSIVLAGLSLGVLYQVVLAGHSGATAVWKDVASITVTGGDGDDD
ncbi:MAG: DUF2231 domain-containing protein [Demequina sp.]|uniref:DUF2231 domain-containing protein n=1 Tax=Demequina sp. TaxID=2050685 RepID=UPI003A83F003